MARQPDVVIIGGGAIGCSAAYYLRSEGLEVALVDKGPVAREASWASAGIIGPSSHPQGDPWFLQATRLSRQLYDDLNPVLFEETGRWMGYGGRGSMTLAMSPGEAAEAEADAERESAAGVALEVLTGSEARRREPALPENLEAVILHPEGRFLDARNYTATIARAAQLKGVKMRPGWPVTALLWDGSRVTGVRSGAERLGAGWVINASGAWAGILDPGLAAPIAPDHGQIMSVEGPAPGLRHTLHRWGSYGYITPRPDGRVVVGATHEEIGFRKQITPAGLSYLAGVVSKVLPGLRDQAMLDIWTGLRPATPDTLPIIGPDPRAAGGFLWAAGHSSSGIMQAPATAKVLTDLVLGRKPRIPLDRVGIERFLS